MKYLPLKLLVIALGVGIIFDILFYSAHGLGINVLLFQIVVIGAAFGLTYHLEHRIETPSVIAAVFALLFAFTFTVWTSMIGMSLSVLGLLTSNFFLALYLLGHHGRFRHPAGVAIEGARRGAQMLLTRISILNNIKIPYVGDRSSAIGRGVLIAVPILLIFGALFLSSDLLLQQKFAGIDEWLQSFAARDIVAQLVVIGFVALSFLIYFAAAFWKRFSFLSPVPMDEQHTTESAIVLVGANVLFLAFILFQAVYLFGSQAAWVTIEGLTYSEYAVQGFNELATVAVLVVLLVLTMRYFHTENVRGKIIVWSEVALLVQTLAIVVSAWMRMSLYVEQYGFTPARLFGFWFFIVVAVLLTTLAVHVVRKVDQSRYVNQALVFCGIAMLVFTMTAPDALSVKLNVARSDDGRIEAFPLFFQLSEEAHGQMKSAFNSNGYQSQLLPIDAYCDHTTPLYDGDRDLFDFTYEKELSEDQHLRTNITYFEDQVLNYHLHPRDDWRSWNWARFHAARDAKNGSTLADSALHFTNEQIAQACGIPLVDPDYTPPSTHEP